jgi:hypothetical protein
MKQPSRDRTLGRHSVNAVVLKARLARPLLRRDWETSGHRTRPDRCVMNQRNLWKVQ